MVRSGGRHAVTTEEMATAAAESAVSRRRRHRCSETVWVLNRAYGLTAQEIAAAMERMLQVEVLMIENEQEVFSAMVALKQGHGSFADALIAGLGARAGCTRTLTFDR
jgi:predicted nucleic-acid-binding protein